jgi:hypothetical protein
MLSVASLTIFTSVTCAQHKNPSHGLITIPRVEEYSKLGQKQRIIAMLYITEISQQ